MNRLLLFLTASILFFEIGCSKSSSPKTSPPQSSSPDTTTTPKVPGPQITAIRPTHGPGGSADTIFGSGFNADISLDTLDINGAKAAISAASDSQLIITVPPLCGTGKVSLAENTGKATGPAFTYDTVYAWTAVAQGFDNPRNLAVDTAGNIYVTNIANGTISVVSLSGSVSTFLSGFQEPWGITIDQNNNMYIADIATTAGTTIYKYNSLGVRSQLATINGFFTSLTCDNSGNVYAVYSDNNSTSTTSVAKISPAGTVTALLTDGGNGISFGICLNPAGGFYLSGGSNGLQSYINTLTSSGTLGYIQLSGNATGIIPSDILFYNGDLYVTCEPGNSIFKISPDGNANPIITDISLPWGIAVDKSGNIIVCSSISGSTAGQVAKITYK